MEREITLKITGKGRCFEFTHEQIDEIVSALQMTSSVYQREFKAVCDQFPNEPQDQKMYWFNKANKFYDLAEDLKNGNFDI